jgi:zinc transport system substrate-binding protein
MTLSPARCAALLLVLLLPGIAQAAPRVVASIPPVHSLVAGMMEGIAEPTLLVSATASAHTYSLRPSDARALSEADLVFWIGPVYETFLEKPLAALAQSGKLVRLADAPGLVLRDARGGGAWESHAHDSHDHSHRGKDEIDGHLFLDPRNAKAMVAAIADALGAADAANAARYRANADRLAARLDALDAELAAIVAPVRDKPFIVFHDAYQYFEARYDLNAVGSVTISPDRQPGARRLQVLRRKIGELSAVCVFAEPQFEPTLLQTVIAGTKARTGTLDYLGVGVPAGPDAYFTTMRAIARSLLDCLQ